MTIPAKYTGSITTTGNSQAIRFEQSFFKALPIPQGPGRVIATILSTGSVLLTFDQPESEWEDEQAPYLAEYLKFVEKSFLADPDHRLVPVNQDMVDAAKRFAKVVPAVSDEEEFTDDVI